MRIISLVATVMLVALPPRVALAQVRTVSDAEPRPSGLQLPALAASALAEWEQALVDRVADADTWSAIGQRLYSAGRYRESIAAFEQALVQRNRHSSDDALCIAESYAKLGNVKQASRWRALAAGMLVPSSRQVRMTV